MAMMASSIPVVVFHDDQDAIAHPRNGDKVMAQFVRQAFF
jgi:hypothetical protein